MNPYSISLVFLLTIMLVFHYLEGKETKKAMKKLLDQGINKITVDDFFDQNPKVAAYGLIKYVSFLAQLVVLLIMLNKVF